MSSPRVKKKMIYQQLIDNKMGAPIGMNDLPRRLARPEHPRTFAMNNISATTIAKVMSAKRPSEHTYLVMNSILCTLDELESWPRAQKVTADREKFVQRLHQYPCDTISLPKLRKIEAYVMRPSYNPDIFNN